MSYTDNQCNFFFFGFISRVMLRSFKAKFLSAVKVIHAYVKCFRQDTFFLSDLSCYMLLKTLNVHYGEIKTINSLFHLDIENKHS